MTSRLLVDKIEGKATAGTVEMPAGHVVQVVHNYDRNVINTTANSYSELHTNLRTSITPKFATSKILIEGVLGQTGYNNTAGGLEFYGQLYDITNSDEVDNSKSRFYDYGTSGILGTNSVALTRLITISSTATLTYNWRIKLLTGVRTYANDDCTTTSITLMEIAQ